MGSDAPVALYDDRCSMCTSFARLAKILAGDGIQIVGHYSERGAAIRASILESDALEMFWLIDGDTAYGGRAALLPLLRCIARSAVCSPAGEADSAGEAAQADGACSASDCGGVRDVFFRSASIIRNSRIIRVRQ